MGLLGFFVCLVWFCFGFVVSIWVKCVKSGHRYPNRCFARSEKQKKTPKYYQLLLNLAEVKGPKLKSAWMRKICLPGLAFSMSHSMREKGREMDIMKSLNACVHQGDHLLLKIKFHLLNHFPRLSVVTE